MVPHILQASVAEWILRIISQSEPEKNQLGVRSAHSSSITSNCHIYLSQLLKNIVAYPLYDVATINLKILFVILWAKYTFSSMPLLSERVNDSHTVVKKNHEKQPASKAHACGCVTVNTTWHSIS